MATRRRPRAAPKQSSARDPRQRLISAALGLAAEQGWRRTGMADIAAEAGLSLHDTYALFRSKLAILIAFRRSIDEAVLAGPSPSANDSPRDRLFDVLMRRFDALKPHRKALQAILRDSIGQGTLVKSLPGFLRSMSWMLAAAAIPNTGCHGRVTARFVAALYLTVLPTFFRDDSADLGTTMATLDRRLRQAESLVNGLRPVTERVRKARA